MGTSLKVHPFAMLPALVPHECPRLLLNLEPAGGIGAHSHSSGHIINKDEEEEEDEDGYQTDEEGETRPAWIYDVVHLGPCDKSVRELCDLLGWRGELEALWKELGGDGIGAGNAAPTANVNHIANRNGTANVTADGDDHNVVNDKGKGNFSESVEPDESAKKSQRDLSEGKAHALEGREGGDLTDVKDNSVEKTLGLIIQDMEGALKLLANDDTDADEHGVRDRALDSNA